MEEESKIFKNCAPYLWWDSPWRVDEDRSHAVAPLLHQAAVLYEKAIESLEKALIIIV